MAKAGGIIGMPFSLEGFAFFTEAIFLGVYLFGWDKLPPLLQWANQFDNTASREAHYRSTGPKIWKQTSGEVSAFVASVGTGGTLAGASLYLKEQNPDVAALCADPYGAVMWSCFTNGNTDTNDGDSIAEGIGQGRVTKNIEGVTVDKVLPHR
jgi:cysteine synthase